MEWLACGRSPHTLTAIYDDEPEKEDTKNPEIALVVTYRQASLEQKAAINALVDAIRNPSAMVWYRLGEAISKIASIFPNKR